jgi:hypothetical protein
MVPHIWYKEERLDWVLREILGPNVSLAMQPSTGYGLLVPRGFLIINKAPQSVGLLWTSDQLVAETST